MLPHDEHPTLDNARALLQRGDNEAAAREIHEYLTACPDNPTALDLLADVRVKQVRLVAAFRLRRRAQRLRRHQHRPANSDAPKISGVRISDPLQSDDTPLLAPAPRKAAPRSAASSTVSREQRESAAPCAQTW